MSGDTIAVTYIGFLDGHNEAVTSLVTGENKDNSPLLISGSRDKNIIIWKLNLDKPEELIFDKEKDYKVGIPFKSLHGHNHFVSSLALSSDSSKLLSGSWDKTMRLWDLPTMKSQVLFKGHNKDVLCVGFSHDERMIFSGSMDKTLKYWNNQGECKYTTGNEFKGWVSCMTNIKKGKENYVAVGSWDSKVTILNSTYQIDRTINGNDYAVTSMSTDNDGDFLFVAYKNGTIRIYELKSKDDENGDTLKQEIDAKVDINAIKFDSAYFQVYALGTSKGLEFRKVKRDSSNEPFYQKEFNCPCYSLTYDKSKKYLFGGFGDGTIRVFKIEESNN